MQQTSDGGYILAGITWSYGAGEDDVYLVKTNCSGDTLWTKTFGGSRGEVGNSVQQTSDGGYIIAGLTTSFGAGSTDVYLIKTNPLGDTLWTRTYGSPGFEYGASVQQTTDGGYIIVGDVCGSIPGSHPDVYVIKTDASGDTLWTEIYGDPKLDEHGTSVQQATDGGYIISFCESQLGNSGLIKMTSTGDILWVKTYGGGGWSFDTAISTRQTADGGYILGGDTYGSGPTNHDAYLVKTDSSGGMLWRKTYGTLGEEHGACVQQTEDGGYIIVGNQYPYASNDQNVYIVKTNSSGDTLWTRTYGGPTTYEWSLAVQQTSDGGYIIAENCGASGYGFSDIFLIKTRPDGLLTSVRNHLRVVPVNFALAQNYPNPFNPSTTIQFELAHGSFVLLKVYNTLGKEVATLVDETRAAGVYNVQFSGEGLSSGVYVYRLQAGDFLQSRKMLLLK